MYNYDKIKLLTIGNNYTGFIFGGLSMQNIIIDENMIKNTKIKSVQCGCFHCLSIFPMYKVTEWAFYDEKKAICPYCGNNTVITTLDHTAINKEILKDTKHKWLEKRSKLAL